ncbi:metallophosphoesterase [Candidatus Woesearchaeota archaeon]|nr:metallophosphoesterase [Candidatus Woesearchaeota archaeon]
MDEIISRLNEEGYLVSKDFISNIPKNFDVVGFLNLLKNKIKDNKEITVLNKDILLSVLKDKKTIELNWGEFDESKALLEKGKDGEMYQTFVDLLNYEASKKKLEKIMGSVGIEEEIELLEEEKTESNVIILKSHKEEAQKRSVDDFTNHFRKRFEILSNILKTRQELKEVISLNRLNGKKDHERICVIGMIIEKRVTKNDNILIRIEDFTGEIVAIINKNNSKIFLEAKDLCDDEIIGLLGSKNGDIIYVEEIVFPDVPLSQGLRKFDEEVYCAFISDVHVGSKVFYEGEFKNFLKWVNGDYGSEEQKNIAKKLKYLFIGGDLVEGVGIYSGQENDLIIKDIYKQYDYFTQLIKKISNHVQIIICPGNHDALRLTEPQPAIGKDYCKDLIEMNNVYMVSNPALVNIHSNANFSGFDVLLYHGTSFNYYMDSVDSIRQNGGTTRADLIMQYLMKRRHLAPTHIATSYIPNPNTDSLVIDKVPDFLLTGHIHRLSVSNYRNVSLINASCWVGQTDFQEKVGLIPEPCKVVVVNLQTRDTKVLNFIDDGSQQTN